MRKLGLTAALILGVGLLWAGCGDDTVAQPDSQQYPDGWVQMDAGVDIPVGDGTVADGPVSDGPAVDGTTPMPASAGQYVVDTLTLPKNASEYAVDLDNNGIKDNQLGAIIAALSIIPSEFGMQENIDYQLDKGMLLLLFEVFAKSLQNDPAMKLQMFVGEDTDGNPNNNFSGSAQLKIDAISPMNLILNGKIASSKMEAGPGEIIAPVAVSSTPTNVTLKKAQVTGTVTTSTIKTGQINGAIPMTDVDNKILPALAAELDATYKTTTDTSLKTILATFDTNKNGTITDTELKNNLIIGALIKADVDTTGDGKPDAMSVGMGYTAVGCKIQKN